MEEVVVKVDDRGRIVLPASVRERLGIGRSVKMRVEGDHIILMPVKDPLSDLQELVVKGTRDVMGEIRWLRRRAEEELFREVERR